MPASSKKRNTAAKKATASDVPGVLEQLQAVAVFQQASDFKLIYANFIQSAFSPLDVALTLGEVMGNEQEKLFVLTKARVTMTPAEAKILQTILSNTIRNYESRFGEIVVPPEVLPPHEG